MLHWKRLEVSGGFLLLTAGLYYLDGDSILPWALSACALHELGHYLAIRLLGGRVSLLRLTCVGAEMRLSSRRPLGPAAQILAALAGPAVNLALALVFARLAGRLGEDAYLFAGLNLALAAFNLLPVAQLDGGRVLRNLLVLLRTEETADRVVQVVSLALAGSVALGGLILLRRGEANLTLPLTALWLLLSPPLTGKARRLNANPSGRSMV